MKYIPQVKYTYWFANGDNADNERNSTMTDQPTRKSINQVASRESVKLALESADNWLNKNIVLHGFEFRASAAKYAKVTGQQYIILEVEDPTETPDDDGVIPTHYVQTGAYQIINQCRAINKVEDLPIDCRICVDSKDKSRYLDDWK